MVASSGKGKKSKSKSKSKSSSSSKSNVKVVAAASDAGLKGSLRGEDSSGADVAVDVSERGQLLQGGEERGVYGRNGGYRISKTTGLILVLLGLFVLGALFRFASDVRNSEVDVSLFKGDGLLANKESADEKQEKLLEAELEREDAYEEAVEEEEEAAEEAEKEEKDETQEQKEEKEIEDFLSSKPMVNFGNVTFTPQTARRWSKDKSAPSWMLNQPHNTYKVPSAKARGDGSLLGRPVPKRKCPVVPGIGIRGSDHSGTYTHLPTSRKCLNMNIFLAQGPRVGSGTVGGVVRRFSVRNMLECPTCGRDIAVFSKEPRTVSSHMLADPMRIMDLSKGDVFKMAFFRDPQKRCASHFLRRIKADKAPTEMSTSFLHYARKNCKNRMFEYYDFNYAPSRDSMDFFGVTERIEESLVVLAHILGLTLGDILFRGSVNVNPNPLSIYTTKSGQIDPMVDQFFGSAEWKTELNDMDYAYYKGANMRLDEYILRIGTSLVEKQVANLRAHNAVLKQGCTEPKPCLFGNEGCGYTCLDMYSVDYGLFETEMNDPSWEPVPVPSNPTFFQRSRNATP